MKNPELISLTLAEARQLIRDRELSPVELVEAHLEQIELYDTRINAFIYLTGELALEQAVRAEKMVMDSNPEDGLPFLLGIPISLKDLYETKGVPTTAG